MSKEPFPAVSFRLNPDLKERLMKIATLQNMTFSGVLHRAAEEYERKYLPHIERRLRLAPSLARVKQSSRVQARRAREKK